MEMEADPHCNPGAEFTNREAAKFLRQACQPWFLFVHCFDPHFNYLKVPGYEYERADLDEFPVLLWMQDKITAEELDPERGLAMYDAEIWRTFALLGELVKQVDLDKTLLIVTSDHGEEFREHGDWAHRKQKLFEENIRVPLMIKFPAGYQPKRNVVKRTVVSNLDIAKTVLDYLGIQAPVTFAGDSLLPLIEKEQPGRFVVCDDGERCVIRGREKWNVAKRLVYDLNKDPQEMQPTMIGQKPFRDFYAKWSAEFVGIDKDIERQLKSLGYIQGDMNR